MSADSLAELTAGCARNCCSQISASWSWCPVEIAPVDGRTRLPNVSQTRVLAKHVASDEDNRSEFSNSGDSDYTLVNKWCFWPIWAAWGWHSSPALLWSACVSNSDVNCCTVGCFERQKSLAMIPLVKLSSANWDIAIDVLELLLQKVFIGPWNFIQSSATKDLFAGTLFRVTRTQTVRTKERKTLSSFSFEESVQISFPWLDYFPSCKINAFICRGSHFES